MPKRPKAYVEFDRLMGQLLTVPKAELDARVQAHKEQAAQNPRKRGPKPKVTQPSADASRDPAYEQ